MRGDGDCSRSGMLEIWHERLSGDRAEKGVLNDRNWRCRFLDCLIAKIPLAFEGYGWLLLDPESQKHINFKIR